MSETNRVERPVKPQREWVTYNPATATYDTPDGTSVAAELVDNVQCLADVLRISFIREQQRKALRFNAKVSGAGTASAGLPGYTADTTE